MDPYKISGDIRDAFTLPSAFYSDEEAFNRSKDGIFAQSWQLAGDGNLLGPTVNSYPFTLLEGFVDEPLLITSDSEHNIACISNVCTHRGNLVVEHPGKRKKLVCGYHGRRFDLSGKFEYMPEFDEALNFPAECDNLTRITLEKWNQFLFVNLLGDVPFKSIREALDERIGFLPVSDFKFDATKSRDYLVKAHWALYCDNYLEGFHIPFVHHDLNTALDYSTYNTILYDYANLQIGYSSDGTEVFDLPDGHPDYGQEVAAYYYWIFPNLMLNFYPWGLSVNIVRPLSVDLTKVSFHTYIYDESKVEQSAGALLDKVEREDEAVVENVHKGLKSRFYDRGRFSPTREQGVHHFHKLLSEYIS
jgi:choline monooxygenase